MHRVQGALFKVLAVLCFTSGMVSAQPANQTAAAPDPLAPFERLIGGQWHLEGSYQEFEWGVGRRSVKARSYFMIDGKPKLVSEGVWFWHPGEGRIKGYFTMIDMPVAFFDYTTRFEGPTMVNELMTFSPRGKAQAYIETWEFKGDASYEWNLLQRTPEGERVVMRGVFRRK